MTPTTLADLRKAIEAVERRSPRRTASAAEEAAWSLGAEALDEALPEGGVCRRSLHDVAAASPGDVPAAAGFALALLARLPRHGDVLWCALAVNRREYGGLYGPGVERLGFDPGRFVQVSVRSAKDLAWAMEEGLRSASLAAVVGEGPALGFTETRRLSLAASETAVPCLFLADPGTQGASAAATRWRVSAASQFQSTPTPNPSPQGGGEYQRFPPPHKGERSVSGFPLPLVGRGRGGGSDLQCRGGDPDLQAGCAAFNLELLRCRGGKPGHWRMTWDHETHSFHPLAPLRDREFPSQPAISRRQAG
jgi:protein ImuA